MLPTIATATSIRWAAMKRRMSRMPGIKSRPHAALNPAELATSHLAADSATASRDADAAPHPESYFSICLGCLGCAGAGAGLSPIESSNSTKAPYRPPIAAPSVTGQ
jgi:hypothetical protein